MKTKGVIAAGHEQTAGAAAVILDAGGNAFDAALAALAAASITEPVLSSLGGGGFLLARPADGQPVLYDFFAHTPRRRCPEGEADFRPIIADFGEAQQEFHIGLASMATPGVVRGLFGVHGDLGSMPMAEILEPASKLATDGVVINALQAYIFTIVEKIYSDNDTCRAIFGSLENSGHLLGQGEILKNPEYADVLDVLAREGEDLFYRGEIATAIADDCRAGGGHLGLDDFEAYQLVRRQPLEVSYGGTRLLTNPPPSTGGLLIAFALGLLEDNRLREHDFASEAHLRMLSDCLKATNEARLASGLTDGDVDGAVAKLLSAEFRDLYRDRVSGHPPARRGTTHISIIDGKGNAAALTVSNGEGAAYMVPGTGIMMNNMLGEEDINPRGLGLWPTDTRMSSMMSPSLLLDSDGRITALGSGGSNRIRSAVLQVILNLTDFRMGLEQAVESPRMHLEGELLSIENGFPQATVAALMDRFPDIKMWQERNLFFGGVHAVRFDEISGRLEGFGDSRRGGVRAYSISGN
ncbi:MAG: gamma-glutamyltransferase [Alphaproteobacteria bacterium]